MAPGIVTCPRCTGHFRLTPSEKEMKMKMKNVYFQTHRSFYILSLGKHIFVCVHRLPLTKSEVEKLYSKGEHSEAEESTGIWCISPEEVKAILRAISKLCKEQL